MKEILIVRSSGEAWDDIVRLFETANARVVVMQAAVVGTLKESAPDLVVAGEENFSAITAAARNALQLFISQSIPPGHLTRGPGGRKTLKIGWPLDEEKLLALTSRLLTIPERRSHRTTVRVTRGEKPAEFLAESLDYSLTGMAFRSPGLLKPQERVTVLFGDTGIDDGLQLPLEVVRSATGSVGGETLYGGRFLHLSPPQRHALERFVWSIREV